MFVQSNDWVFATPEDGLSYDDLSGDITDLLVLIDAATEADQPVGEGADQAPRQAGPNTGADDENSDVRIVEGFNVSDNVKVSAKVS